MESSVVCQLRERERYKTGGDTVYKGDRAVSYQSDLYNMYKLYV